MDLFELTGKLERLIEDGKLEEAKALGDEHKELIPENVLRLVNGVILASNVRNFEHEWEIAVENKKIDKSNERKHSDRELKNIFRRIL